MQLQTREEAIYTFRLPEEVVVTALPLWINGREEKGQPATKEKAAKAYNTTVAMERREPLVVHWQEGNMVSVRVFPVTTQESRIFRTGITAPLGKSGDRLTYGDIYFEGPSSAAATEELSLGFDHKQASLPIPAAQNSPLVYIRYRPFPKNTNTFHASRP